MAKTVNSAAVLFTEVKKENLFPIDFYRTENLFATSAIAIWWPCNRMQVFRHFCIGFVFLGSHIYILFHILYNLLKSYSVPSGLVTLKAS